MINPAIYITSMITPELIEDAPTVGNGIKLVERRYSLWLIQDEQMIVITDPATIDKLIVTLQETKKHYTDNTVC